MTSKEINDLIESCDLIPGDEGITRRLLMISHALNQRIDDLEDQLRAIETTSKSKITNL